METRTLSSPSMEVANVAEGGRNTFGFAVIQTNALVRELVSQIRISSEIYDADAVHDLRVGIRRLMQALFVFAPCFGASRTGTTRRRLKGIMAAAGVVRNWDIAAQLCGEQAARYLRKIQSHRDDARQKLMAALQHWTSQDFSSRLNDTVSPSAARNREFGGTGIEDTANRTLCKMTKKFFHAGNRAVKDSASPRELHRFRLAAKAFRYTLELFLPLYGPQAAIRLNQIKAIQTKLGEVNDCETVRGMLARWDRGRRIDRFLRKRESRNIDDFRGMWNSGFADSQNVDEWLLDWNQPRREPRLS